MSAIHLIIFDSSLFTSATSLTCHSLTLLLLSVTSTLFLSACDCVKWIVDESVSSAADVRMNMANPIGFYANFVSPAQSWEITRMIAAILRSLALLVCLRSIDGAEAEIPSLAFLNFIQCWIHLHQYTSFSKSRGENRYAYTLPVKTELKENKQWCPLARWRDNSNPSDYWMKAWGGILF